MLVDRTREKERQKVGDANGANKHCIDWGNDVSRTRERERERFGDQRKGNKSPFDVVQDVPETSIDDYHHHHHLYLFNINLQEGEMNTHSSLLFSSNNLWWRRPSSIARLHLCAWSGWDEMNVCEGKGSRGKRKSAIITSIESFVCLPRQSQCKRTTQREREREREGEDIAFSRSFVDQRCRRRRRRSLSPRGHVEFFFFFSCWSCRLKWFVPLISPINTFKSISVKTWRCLVYSMHWNSIRFVVISSFDQIISLSLIQLGLCLNTFSLISVRRCYFVLIDWRRLCQLVTDGAEIRVEGLLLLLWSGFNEWGQDSIRRKGLLSLTFWWRDELLIVFLSLSVCSSRCPSCVRWQVTYCHWVQNYLFINCHPMNKFN